MTYRHQNYLPSGTELASDGTRVPSVYKALPQGSFFLHVAMMTFSSFSGPSAWKHSWWTLYVKTLHPACTLGQMLHTMLSQSQKLLLYMCFYNPRGTNAKASDIYTPWLNESAPYLIYQELNSCHFSLQIPFPWVSQVLTLPIPISEYASVFPKAFTKSTF